MRQTETGSNRKPVSIRKSVVWITDVLHVTCACLYKAVLSVVVVDGFIVDPYP